MGKNIIHSILYGLISGFSEFLPVSLPAHQYLYVFFTGFSDSSAFLKLMVYIGCLAALLVSCRTSLIHMRRENRIASVAKNKRKRVPDMVAVLNFRLMLVGMIPMFLLLLFSGIFMRNFGKLTWIAGMLTISGFLVYMPVFFPVGNRDSQNMGPLDGLLLGLCSGLSVIPGISGMGAIMCAGRSRGCSRTYILEVALLFTIPVLAGLIFGYIILVVSAGAIELNVLISGLIAAVSAFGGGVAGIYLMRYLAVKLDFHAFSYYCWGLAAFCLIYYLII